MYRRRHAAILLGLALALAACANVVDGHGTNNAAPISSAPPTGATPSGGPSGGSSGGGFNGPSNPPSTGGPATGTPSSSSAPAQLTTSDQLVPLLEKPPSGSQPWGDDWGNNVTPTLQEFVSQVYDSSAVASVSQQLQSEGITGIAHRTWIASTGTQADIVLLEFSSVAGAQHRLNFIAVSKRDAGGVKKFIVAKPSHLQTFYTIKPDSDGYIRSITYTRVGHVVLEVFGFSKKKVAKAEIIKWGGVQAGLLQ